MTTEQLIAKIISSHKIEDIVDVSNFKASFNKILKEIHPDLCKLPGADNAVTKMNLWKDHFQEGATYEDELGKFKTNGYWLDFESDSPALKWSVDNYKILKDKGLKANLNFVKYIPDNVEDLGSNKYRFNFKNRAIPLVSIPRPIEQKHVNWIANRLFEYAAYLRSLNMSHCGFTPESVFVVPETHGIQVCSFYHMTAIDKKIGTISAKYAKWYPAEIFTKKLATPFIDVEMTKRIAAYLLGDDSGMGVKLRKTHDVEYVNFLNAFSKKEPFDVMDEYKQLLAKNYKKEFHVFNI